MTHPRIPKRLGALLATAATCVALAACVAMPTASPGANPNNSQTLSDLVSSGVSMQAERGSGELEINRMTPCCHLWKTWKKRRTPARPSLKYGRAPRP